MRDFRRLLTGRFFLTFSVQMQSVIIGWRMYELTGQPLFLGLVGLAEAIPALGLAIPAGTFVDRSNPLRTYAAVVLGSVASAAVLVLAHIPWLALTVPAAITALFVSSFLTGCARAFSQPCVYAMVPRMVSRDMLSRCTAWTTTTMQTARIAGPAFGGMAYGFLGAEASAILVFCFLLCALAGVLSIQADLPAPVRPPAVDRKEELFSGLKYVFEHPILLPALSLDMVSVLFGGVTALLPIYASDILQVGPRGLGILRGAPALGAALVALWLTRREIKERAGAWLFVSVVGFGVCILIFGVSTSFPLSVLALALSGAFDSVSMVVRSTAVQLLSPDGLRGRISAVNSMFIGSSNELGQLESGVAAHFLGTVPSVLFGGVMCLLTVAIAAFYAPDLRKLHLGKI